MQPWQTREPDGKEQFIRLGFSFLECPEFTDLKKKHPKAALMYIEMLKEAGTRAKFSFTQKQAAETLGMCKDTYTQSIKYLDEAGLIRVKEHNKNLRKPNVYEFVWNWQKQQSGTVNQEGREDG